MNRALRLVVTTLVLILIPTSPSEAVDELKISCGPGVTYTVLMPAGIIKSSKGCVGDLVIDSRVKVILNSAFAYSELTSVIIPNSVKVIEAFAFYEVDTLKNVSFGNSLEEIGGFAFKSTSLKSITVPPSVKMLGNEVFANILTLETVSIPDNISANDFIFSTEKDVLELFDSRNYSLTRIEYCGDLPLYYKNSTFNDVLFPVNPVCPPERKEAYAAKIAKELKAKQEAEAKAAAELREKQDAAIAIAGIKSAQDAQAKAEAEAISAKEAQTKAETEAKAAKEAQTKAETEAKSALADSQKVNREQAARITSFEEQFKVLTESVNALQSQVSQLNTRLTAAVSGLNSANAKIKKICAAKPKPKGC